MQVMLFSVIAFLGLGSVLLYMWGAQKHIARQKKIEVMLVVLMKKQFSQEPRIKVRSKFNNDVKEIALSDWGKADYELLEVVE